MVKSKVNHIRWWGLMTKALIYILIGVLTLLAALNLGGEVAGKNAAIDFMRQQIYGRILVTLLCFGLIAYAVWRLHAARTDAKDAGSDGSGYLKRIGYAISGMVYGALGTTTIYQIWTGHDDGSSDAKQTIAARILEKDWGGYRLICHCSYSLRCRTISDL